MAVSDLTTSAIDAAIEEFDQLTRDRFLKKYGFRKSRRYLIEKKGHRYDSKAIVGAAHGYLPGQAPLAANDFSGGEATVKRTLESLGFHVVDLGPDDIPQPGEVLTNDELMRRFAVGMMGGMRRSTELNLLLLISDPFKGLYQDRWEGDVLHYTGMGQKDDQDIDHAQNATLAHSQGSGIPVHLVEALEQERYTYAGLVELAGIPYQEQQIDDAGKPRSVWMFPIRLKQGGTLPVPTEGQARRIEEAHARIARKLTTDELKNRAKNAPQKPAVRGTAAVVFVRDPAVAEYAKRLANGLCDLCQQAAPFHNKKNEAYLECHHIVWLADGGEDTIANTVALCPNCHRKMHVRNDKADRTKLAALAGARALL